ncbi:glycosyltransferase family 2 protein, partial [Salmonella enterica subsp. houtenae]|nr:glycosyltransferase family 2 protein [Salmonella enterica subsp. houtenae]
MSDISKIVIFTPTYNRAHTLTRCYESIVNQNYKNLTWMVIDDGSTDNTRSLIDKFIFQDKINIVYRYQKNAGKQGAWNKAVNLSQEYDAFLCLDSDDVLLENCISHVSSYFSFLKENDIIGLRCLAIRQSTNKPDSLYNLERIEKKTWYDELFSRQLGERSDIFDPKKLINYLYPVDETIKFVPEIWFYAASAQLYKYIYIPVPLTKFYDKHGHLRLSRESFSLHIHGHKKAREMVLRTVPLKILYKNPMFYLKNLIRYFQCLYYIFI